MSIQDYIVISSVDGTLLKAGYGIPAGNIDAVEAFRQRGGQFTVCTVRGREGMERVRDWLPLNAPAILDDGTYIYDFDSGEVLFENPLAGEAETVVRELMEMYPSLGVEVTVEPLVFVPRMTSAIHEHLERDHTRYMICDLEDIPHGWHKAVLSGNEKDILSARKYAYLQQDIKDEFAEFNYTVTPGGMLELQPMDSSKALALKELGSLLEVPLNAFIGLGSAEADVPFLDLCGISAAVSDAPMKVRNACDMVVSSCLRCGAAELLARFNDITNSYEQISLD